MEGLSWYNDFFSSELQVAKHKATIDKKKYLKRC